MKRKLLFTRRFKGELYSFYHNVGVGPFGLESSYFSVETPPNTFGYPDTILFSSGGVPYTLYRYLAPWILNECKKAFLKKGYQIK